MLLPLALLALVPVALAQNFQGYYPILVPSSQKPWVAGSVNSLEWDVGFDGFAGGFNSFDIILQSSSSSDGPVRIATQVKFDTKALAISLPDSVPALDDYHIVFHDTWTGQTFTQSDKFSVKASGDGTPTTPSKGAKTITVTDGPGPDTVFAATLNGPVQATSTNTMTGEILPKGSVSLAQTRIGLASCAVAGAVAAGVVLMGV